MLWKGGAANAFFPGAVRARKALTAIGCENPTIVFIAGSVLRLENSEPAYKLPTGKPRLEHLADSTPTAALRLAAFRQAMSANYMILLDKMVF